MTKLDLFQICKADSIFENHINMVKKETHETEESDKIQHPFVIKKKKRNSLAS